MRMQWREQWDDETDAQLRKASDLLCFDPSLTDTSKAKDADLNEVIRRYGITDGSITPMAADPRFYGDFSDATDFRGVLDATRAAIETFGTLPAKIRERFRNDPAYLHDWVNDPQNQEEAIQLGLLSKKAPYIPPEVRNRQDVLDWAAKPENAAEATRLGLIQPPAPAPVAK